MDFRQSLDYLYGLQRFGIKLGLENIRALLERLGRPERGYGIVHVAGTNGKGSLCACLAEILRRAGYRVGLYSSPHLHCFTERIRVNGCAVPEAEVARLTAEVRSRAGAIPATFFEFTTALALLYFQRQKVDFVILEVGMGGRLDATNAVLPQLCAITPICLDHAEHLGETLAAVAAEKAGIIKEGVPVVIGRQEPEALSVLLDQARRRNAPAVVRDRDFSPVPSSGGFSFRGLGLQLDALRPALPGGHQHDNLAQALAAAAILGRQGAALPQQALRGGVEHVCWPGRLEWWGGGKAVLLDGAHNGGGARALADYLRTFANSGIRWVVGLKGDKRIEDVLGPILPMVKALYCACPPVEEAVPPGALVRRGRDAGVEADAYASPEAALEEALAAREEGEIVLVAGSLFLVASARQYLMTRSEPEVPVGLPI